MDDPEVVAEPPPPKPKKRWGRSVLIASLIVLVGILVLFVAMLYFLRTGASRPDDEPNGSQDSASTAPPSKQTDSRPHYSTNGSMPPRSEGATGARRDVLAKNQPDAAPDFVWNYWLTDQADAVVPKPSAQPIELNTPQRLQFRLSSFDLAPFYEHLQTLAGSPQLRTAVAAGLADPLRHTLELDVLVQSTDDDRLRIAPSSRRMHMSIDLDARRRQTQRRPAAGAPPDPELLKSERLAEFGIDFAMLAPGTHEAGIVIVDAATGFPLQTMVASFADASTAGPGVSVRSNGKLAGGGGTSPAYMTLYLYDLSSRQHDVFSQSLSAQLYYRTASGYDLISWRTDTDLAGLRDATRSFNAAVGSLKNGADLLQPGADFGRHVFGPSALDASCEPGSNCAASRQARAIITAAAKYPEGHLPPTMVVHIVSGQLSGLLEYASDVFPFGAMGVVLDEGSEPVYLGERFALALVLSDQRFARTTVCPGQWYFALPNAADHAEETDPLGKALTGLAPLLGRVKPDLIHRQPRDLGTLRTWLNQTDPPGRRTYVLAYLGHHTENNLHLDQTSLKGISSGGIQRSFERASIAILNACTSATSSISGGSLIGRFAQLHVDSTIATTSPVSGELAAAYLDCLDAVLEDKRQLTVGEAHALATQCLWSERSSARWRRDYDYHGAALKYVLIGDPNQPLCPPARKESP